MSSSTKSDLDERSARLHKMATRAHIINSWSGAGAGAGAGGSEGHQNKSLEEDEGDHLKKE